MNHQYFEKKTIQTRTYSIDYVLDHFNRRLKVDHILGSVEDVLDKVEELAIQYSYEKIIMFIRSEQFPFFLSKAYTLEAIINAYFNGSDGYILTKYFEISRRNSDKWVSEDQLLTAIYSSKKNRNIVELPDKYRLSRATTQDAKKLAKLYSTVFQIYPTPLNDEAYIKHVLSTGSIFYCIYYEDEIVSAASADINEKYSHAELTDCATLSEHRKHGFMKLLLTKLEEDLASKQIFCAFSIARALSYGMNDCFAQLGYTYRGRLANNCYIFDKIEDMNVWVKDLSSIAEN